MKNVLLVLMCLCFTKVFTQNSYQTVYGGDGTDKALSGVKLSNGQSIFVGTSTSFNGGNDGLVVALNTSGDTIWTKAFTGHQSEYLEDVVQYDDQHFIITGRTYSYGHGYVDMIVLKMDTLGTVVWSKTIGGTSVDEGDALAIDNDGNIIIIGKTSSIGEGNADVFVVKVSGDGDLIWSKSFASSNEDIGTSLAVDNSGDYIIGGYTCPEGTNDCDNFLLKIDKEGSIQWCKAFDSGGSDKTNDVSLTSAGNILMAGEVIGTGAGSTDGSLIKLDAEGEILWSNTYGGGGYDLLYGAKELQNGNYILIGEERSFNNGYPNLYFIETNTIGETILSISVGQERSETEGKAKLSSDNVLTMGSVTSSFDGYDEDFYMLSINISQLNEICNSNEVSTKVNTYSPSIYDLSMSVQNGNTLSSFLFSEFNESLHIQGNCFNEYIVSDTSVNDTIVYSVFNEGFETVIYYDSSSVFERVTLNGDSTINFYSKYEYTNSRYNDTLIETVTVHDTLIETIFLYDTIDITHDIYDTTIISDTIFAEILDTQLILDTTILEFFDTIHVFNDLYDTTVIYDTIATEIFDTTLLSVEDTLIITLSISTGLEGIEDELMIWSDGSNIYFESDLQEDYSFELISMTGVQVLYIEDINVSDWISLNGIAKGIYIAKFNSLTDEDLIFTKKIVVR